MMYNGQASVWLDVGLDGDRGVELLSVFSAFSTFQMAGSFTTTGKVEGLGR